MEKVWVDNLMPGWSTATAISRLSYGWISYSHITDASKGVDFVPKAAIAAPARASINRPLQIWNLSVITSSNFSAERMP